MPRPGWGAAIEGGSVRTECGTRLPTVDSSSR
jgi:hypothetical protein